MPDDGRVLIAGAGPVGLTAALRLAQLGVPATVLEQRIQLSRGHHASVWLPPALDLFAQLGILEGALRTGMKVQRLAYRRAGTAAPIARFDLGLLGRDTRFPFRLHLERDAVSAALAARLTFHPHTRLQFDAEVVAVMQDHTGVSVRVQSALGERVERGAFLLAADGPASAVRRALGIGLQGSSATGRLLEMLTPGDLGELVADAECCWIHAPGGWCGLLRMPHLWQVALPLAEAEDAAAALDEPALRSRLARFLPFGSASLPLIGRGIRTVRRQVAASHVAGRVLLAGDAAHQADTRAGLNMNCGLQDAIAAAEALAHALRHPAQAPARLDAYARERHQVVTAGLLPFADRATPGGEAWLADLTTVAADPTRARAWLRSAAMLDVPGIRAAALPA